jgi:hypothetical protein
MIARLPIPSKGAVALGGPGGLKGGKAHTAKLTAEQRRELARKALNARWAKARGKNPAEGPARQNLIAARFLPKIDLRRPRGYLDRQRTGPQELVESGRFCFTCGKRASEIIPLPAQPALPEVLPRL